jgi:alpha-1,2-mannosyltransferase
LSTALGLSDRLAARTSARADWLAAIVPGLVALGICCYQLSRPYAFTGVQGADDGVYLAPALRLLHGQLPYLDYAFVHPPAIVWLMTPLGVFGDTSNAMAASRVVTALVAGANASLAALIVRSYGRAASLFAGLALAVFPVAVTANHTLTLDPYLVFFCLLGTLALFTRGELAAGRRIVLAGALFGVAGAVKAWAIFPALAALAVCVPYWLAAARPFLAGLVAGFAAPSLPFFLAAPGSFVHDVVVAQITRKATGQGFDPLGQRLALILGIATPSTVASKARLAEVLLLALAGLVIAVYFLPARRSTRFELFALAAAAATTLAMVFLVTDFYTYYAVLPAAFGALLLAICLGRLVDGLRWAGDRLGGAAPRAFELAASAGLPLALLAAAALALVPGLRYARSFMRVSYDPRPTISANVPRGSCLVFDEVGNAIASRRLFSSRPGCPPLVDAFGLWLTDNRGVTPPARPVSDAFVAKWRSWLERADFLLLTVPQSDYVPWTPELTAWFDASYRLVASAPRLYVYRRVAA